MFVRVRVFVCLIVLVCSTRAFAQPAPNVVIQWAAIVQQSIHNAAAPRSAGSSEVLQTMVQLAVYDAVVSIEGGGKPYAVKGRAWQGADVRAAVATAAYLTARARVAASQIAYLDQQYAGYLATIADGPAKTDGIAAGTESAETMLALRANDGFSNVVTYQCSAVPPPVGEFEPDTGCPSAASSPQPVDVKLGQIAPYVIKNLRPYQVSGPVDLTSKTYTQDFIETRDMGRADSAMRTPEQTDVAFFWSENPYVHWNRNLSALALASELSVGETARFFAMVHASVSDAIIVGFGEKYRFSRWRPRTAIPQADADGNPDTDADTQWRPLLSVNHPEYPSGHGFWSGALIDAVAAFFGSDQVNWTITTSKAAVPRVNQTERTYGDLNTLKREIYNARVWGGLHWRFSMADGEQIGREVARYVTRTQFKERK
jgi:hypothetical protein